MYPVTLSGCKLHTVKRKTTLYRTRFFAFGSYLISYSLVLIAGWRFHSASTCLEGNNVNNAFLSSICVIGMKLFPWQLSSGETARVCPLFAPLSHTSPSLIWKVWLIQTT